MTDKNQCRGAKTFCQPSLFEATRPYLLAPATAEGSLQSCFLRLHIGKSISSRTQLRGCLKCGAGHSRKDTFHSAGHSDGKEQNVAFYNSSLFHSASYGSSSHAHSDHTFQICVRVREQRLLNSSREFRIDTEANRPHRCLVRHATSLTKCMRLFQSRALHPTHPFLSSA